MLLVLCGTYYKNGFLDNLMTIPLIVYSSAPSMKTSTATANNPDIPEPDYSPIIIRKSKKPKAKRNNMNLWGNAARYRGSLEELDQEEISPDESQGSSSAFKVRHMAEKLKVQAERDRRRQVQRGSPESSSSNHAKEFQSLRPMKSSENGSRSRRSVSEERDHDSVLSDSFSMLSMSNSNIPGHHHRMSQYSPRYNSSIYYKSNLVSNLCVNFTEAGIIVLQGPIHPYLVYQWMNQCLWFHQVMNNLY